MRLPILALGSVLALATLNARVLAAADLEAQSRALTIIADQADRICTTPPLLGTRGGAEFTGEAKVKLDNLLARLFDVGAALGGRYQSEEYKGVLRSELATAIKNSNDCKLTVQTTLLEKLFPNSAGALPRAQPVPPVPGGRVNEVKASLRDPDPAKQRAALRSALSDPEPGVRSEALFDVLTKLKVIGGEAVPIGPGNQRGRSQPIQLYILSLDPATGQLTAATGSAASRSKYIGSVQGTSILLASSGCTLNLELDLSRTLRGTLSCAGNSPRDVRLPIM